MAGLRSFVGVCVVAAGCAHGAGKNPMFARAAADLRCDAQAVRWQALGDQGWIAHGCDRQATYVVRCHDTFENPARPTYPPIEVCEWSLDSVRADVAPPPISQPPQPPQTPQAPPPDAG